MRIYVKQNIELTGISEYSAAVEVLNECGQVVSTWTQNYPRSNEIYAAYKSFQQAIKVAIRSGCTDLDIETNVRGFARELGGNRNPNTALYNQTMTRLSGIKIGRVTLVHGGLENVI